MQREREIPLPITLTAKANVNDDEYEATMSSSDYGSDSDDDDDETSSDESSCFDDDDDDDDDDPTPTEKKNGLFLSLEMVQMLRRSTSEGNLNAMLPPSMISKMTPARRTSGGNIERSSKMVFAIQTKSSLESHAQHKEAESVIVKPKETLRSILHHEFGIPALPCKCSSDMPNFFVRCCVASHSSDLMTAVRQNDLVAIQKYHAAGKNLQCANKFQESLVHTVARRGLPDMLTYLHQVAGVSLRVCCDGGRTILHDACWTGQPNFALIGIIVRDTPDLLYITDKRNFSPLDYIPKEAHDVWNTWLHEHKDLLAPRELL